MSTVSENLLMDCLDLLEQGVPMADILARYPDQAEALRPYLETELNTELDGRWELFINNNGLGPAHVNNVQYFVDGKSYENREDFLVALGEDPGCFGRGNIARFYKVADRQMVYTALNKPCFKTEAALRAMSNRMQIVINYQSLYGESFQLVIGKEQRSTE